jgi:hypothetical protein
MRVINPWKELLDTLDTPGGHLVLLLLLFGTGALLQAAGVPEGRDVMVGSFSALLLACRGRMQATRRPSGARRDRSQARISVQA